MKIQYAQFQNMTFEVHIALNTKLWPSGISDCGLFSDTFSG
jgi:hypothetical protein